MQPFDPTLIGERIREVREDHLLTKSGFLQELGSSRNNKSTLWEDGTFTPSAYYQFMIAQRFQVSVDWLLGLTDQRNSRGR
ncbi:MAG: helix-turn-helix transcriptional regulator [Oscillospiraceae bacterium]|nr:helix-turn-helix transcriptional regulator [Oscillospiraceae bacterium]